MKQITDKIHVNAPFKMLYETYLGYFIKHRLNPEISFDAVTLESFSMSDFRKVAEQLLAHNLSITFHGPFMDLCPGSSDPGIRELTRHRFEQVLELIPLFKPKIMVCHAGYDWKRYLDKRDFWIEKSLEIWSWLGATCGQALNILKKLGHAKYSVSDAARFCKSCLNRMLHRHDLQNRATVLQAMRRKNGVFA
ncbi:MAG: hypothetical protein GY749_24490 [Desulfobacteraceae bacterium]|nr:hypothetical protein [Desulfobacteraceae bacterium]